jgi:transcriptional regulator with XRE-family HTH domain
MIKPGACIEPNPNARSCYFGQRWVNISEVGRKSGLSRSYISHVFAGRKNPTLHSMAAIAKALDITTSEFLQMLENHHKERLMEAMKMI